MPSLRPLVLRPAALGSGGAPAGPAMTVLGTLIARITVIVRGIALAEMVVQVIIWRDFYLARPWLLWAPVLALAWGGAAMAYLHRRRPAWQFVCADTAAYAALALGAAWCVPPALRGEAGSWGFILVTSQLVTPVWLAPRALSMPLALTPVLGYAAGTALAPASHLVAGNQRKASLILMFVILGVHWLVRRMLAGRAAKADAELAAADREARGQYVILSENIERREQDRIVHDTILNTLTAIARSGGSTAVVSQCRQDIALLEAALSASGAAPVPGQPGADLLAAIDAVAGEMRARGLAVDLEFTGTAAPGAVPGPVVAAMAHATREALANVAAHAGTGTAWVTVVISPGDPAAPGRLQVTIRDEGAGFRPGGVDPARLGVRRSIAERIEDRGGSASVRSAPGQGTVVRLCWPAAGPGSEPARAEAAGTAVPGVPG